MEHKFCIRPLISVLHYNFWLRSFFLYTGSIFHFWTVITEAGPSIPWIVSPVPHCFSVPVYVLNLYYTSSQSLQHWVGCSSSADWWLQSADSFCCCGFQDESIFTGWSTQCVSRSVTSHLTVWIYFDLNELILPSDEFLSFSCFVALFLPQIMNFLEIPLLWHLSTDSGDFFWFLIICQMKGALSVMLSKIILTCRHECHRER